MVEEEAHTANLTQRIKGLLNVPDTQPPQERGPLIAGATKPAEIESTIDEVEEELEVEGENDSNKKFDRWKWQKDRRKRRADELRTVKITVGAVKNADGSAFIEFGKIRY